MWPCTFLYITLHLLLYIPEFSVADDVVPDEAAVVAVTSRTQTDDDIATNSPHFTDTFLLHVLVLRDASRTGPMCCPKGGHVSCCATLADWAIDSNAPVLLVHDIHRVTLQVFMYVALPVASTSDHVLWFQTELAGSWRDRRRRDFERCCTNTLCMFDLPGLSSYFLRASAPNYRQFLAPQHTAPSRLILAACADYCQPPDMALICFQCLHMNHVVLSLQISTMATGRRL